MLESVNQKNKNVCWYQGAIGTTGQRKGDSFCEHETDVKKMHNLYNNENQKPSKRICGYCIVNNSDNREKKE